MQFVSQAIKFGLFSILLIVIPGPSVLYVIARGLSLGTRAALGAVIGNTIGILVQGVAVSLGFGALVGVDPKIANAIKLVGALYLFYIGVRMWISRDQTAISNGASRYAGSLNHLRQGFIVGVLNPKSAVVFGAVLGGFVVPALGHPTLQALALVVEFCVLALLSDGAWALTSGNAAKRIGAAQIHVATVRSIGSFLVCGVALLLFIDAIKA